MCGSSSKSGVIVGEKELLEQRGKTYQCCVRPICCTAVKRGNFLLWMREVAWGGASLIRMMCGMILVARVSTDVLRVGVIVNIEDIIIQSRLQWYDHVICQNINSEIL